MTTIAEQDTERFTWYFRVLAYNAMGGVVDSMKAFSDEDLEGVHDHLLEQPDVKSTFTVGPFREARR